MRVSERSRDDQFRAYVLEAREGMVRTATLLTAGDAHEAEDLVQTVLLRLYLSWRKVRPESRAAYVRKMLVNAHVDEHRRPYARNERNQADLPEIAVEPATPPDANEAVFRALATLPPGMRAAVVLRHIHDASVAETADALGCSEGNVKSQTARGLAQLRAALTHLSHETSDQTVADHQERRAANE
jgi:RNA polymerase sigma-70 factor (sigma-E family)